MTNSFVGDIGTKIRITIKDQDEAAVDLTDITSVVFKVKDPNAVLVTWTPVVVESATGGIVYYLITSGDIDDAGTYYIQPYIVFTSGDTYSGETHSLRVFALYEQ